MHTQTHTHTQTNHCNERGCLSQDLCCGVSCQGGKNIKKYGMCVSGVRGAVCEFVHLTCIGVCDEETLSLLHLFPLLPPSLTPSPSPSIIFCPAFLFLSSPSYFSPPPFSLLPFGLSFPILSPPSPFSQQVS